MDTAVFTPDWYTPQARQPKKKAQQSWFWLGSLLLHGIFLVPVILFQRSHAPDLPTATETIKARLVFAPISKKQAEPELLPPNETSLLTAPVSQPANPRQVNANTEQQRPHPDTREIRPSTFDDRHPDIPEAKLNLSPSVALQTLQSRRRQALVENAGRQRRRLLTSPQLHDPHKGKEEADSSFQTHKINCDKGVNNVIGLLSGLTGGSLECSNRGADIESFINKHKK
ncbi:hypothetical protein OPS25_14820 [Alteromonas ponticola]|uniref:Uncharacterized protein n=1 Tax=Alteromonas aquimaris TaxID=2998417 RepID=A0ABT3PAH7_9ALTE|nr:hypothetical protein [Alteromonas aquimaris]MCW8109777.1 hypothetical protein [Alteromonas aquimaris]